MKNPLLITLFLLTVLAIFLITNQKYQPQNIDPKVKQIKQQKKSIDKIKKQSLDMTNSPEIRPSLIEAQARLEEKKITLKIENSVTIPTLEPPDIIKQTKAHNQDFDDLRKVSLSIEKNILKKYTPFLLGLENDKAMQVYEILSDYHMNIFGKVANQELIDMNAEKTDRDNKIKQLLDENEFKKYQLFLPN